MDPGAGRLAVDGLTVRFGGVVALSEVAMDVAPAEIHGLIGPNGAGKTTLLNCLSRLVEPTSGTIRFDGTDLRTVGADGIAGLGIARTFQNLGLVPDMTVLENVMSGMHARSPGGLLDELVLIARRRRREEERRAGALAVLALAGLLDDRDRPVGELPYGRRKAVEFARAAAQRPKLLLLDEPTAGLARRDMAELRDTIVQLRDGTAAAVIVITHHVEFLLSVASRVTVLEFGRRIAQGEAALVRTDARVASAYLGRPA